MMSQVSRPRRALVAGATCVLILCGMIVGHAWPLWRGRTVTMTVIPVDPRDLFRGEFVRLNTAATQLYREDPRIGRPITWSVARPLDDVYEQSQRGALVYVQLAPTPAGDYAPVSVSRKPVEGAINLRGRDKFSRPGSGVTNVLYVDYGLDAFYMEEGRARRVEDAMRAGKEVQMEVSIAASGQARIRTLLIGGVPVDRF